MSVRDNPVVETEELNDWRIYDGGQLVLTSITKEDAEADFKILSEYLEKYRGKTIEWQRCLFDRGGFGSVV